jgi:hypothetical protein
MEYLIRPSTETEYLIRLRHESFAHRIAVQTSSPRHLVHDDVLVRYKDSSTGPVMFHGPLLPNGKEWQLQELKGLLWTLTRPRSPAEAGIRLRGYRSQTSRADVR